MKKIIKITLSALMFAGFSGFVSADMTKKLVEDSSPVDLYLTIKRQGDDTFRVPWNYFQAGLKNFTDKWASVFSSVGGYFSSQKKKPISIKYYDPKQGKGYFYQLLNINNWLYDTVSGKKNNATVRGQNSIYLKNLKTIISTVYQKIIQESKRGDSLKAWEKSIQGSRDTVFPDLDSFLKAYAEAKYLDDSLLGSGFWRRENVINKYSPKGLYQITNVLENLEKAYYLTSFAKRSLRNQIKSVVHDINVQYPFLPYPPAYQEAKFKDSNDKASVLIVSIARQLEYALDKLEKELKKAQ